MAKLFDEQGNEIEAFTAEELKGKNQEAVDAYLKEHPDQSQALEEATKKLEDANIKLKKFEDGGNGGGGEDGQKKRLIKERDDANKALEEVKNSFMGEINKLKETFFGGTKNKILEKLSGGDSELKKKIELEYDGFKGDVSTEADIMSRMTKAYTIAKGVPPSPNFMDGVNNAGNKGSGNGGEGVVSTETDNGKAQRKALGISDEDAKKFAPDANK